MELPLSLQGVQFLLSALVGLAYGIHYDILRGLRRTLPAAKHLLDFWFALTFLIGNLLLALYVGNGEYRIFMLLGTALAMVVYFVTISRFFLLVFTKFWQFLTFPLRFICKSCKKFLRKLLKKVKNIFSSRKKSVTIDTQHKRIPKNLRLEGTPDETQIITHYKAHHSGRGDLRSRNHRRPSAEN